MLRIRRELTGLFFAVIAYFNFATNANQQFSGLAEAFLHAQTYFDTVSASGIDTVLFHNKYYWPLGPVPALLLVPFVYVFRYLGFFFFQGYLQIFLIVGVYYCFSRIARELGYDRNDAAFLGFAFCFASSFLGVAMYSVSWAFAQVVTVQLEAFTLLEYLRKKRAWLIGMLMALTLATRLTAGLNILFFIMATAFESSETSKKMTRIIALCLPVLFASVGLAIYNEVRFGSWLEQGYGLQILYGPSAHARSYGLISPIHIPGNLFYFLLAGPQPVTLDGVSQVLKFPYFRANLWGMSLFITSPYFLYLFYLKYGDLISKLLLVSITTVAVPIFTYYGIGYVQFGYRYALDFLPFLFFLLIRNLRAEHDGLPSGFKKITLLSAVTNFYMVTTMFL